MPLNCCVKQKKIIRKKCKTAKRNAQQERWPWNKNKRRIIQYKHQTSKNELIMWSEMQAKIPAKLDVAEKSNVFCDDFNSLEYSHAVTIYFPDLTWTRYDSTKMHFFFPFCIGFPYYRWIDIYLQTEQMLNFWSKVVCVSKL